MLLFGCQLDSSLTDLHSEFTSWLRLLFLGHRPEHCLSAQSHAAALRLLNPLCLLPQALPYSCLLMFIPMHFLTFELLLFLTGVWTTNIHDCVDGK